MVYMLPVKYKCPQCDFEMEYSPSNHYTFLPIGEDGKPFCYKCLIKFIADNVPLMEYK